MKLGERKEIDGKWYEAVKEEERGKCTGCDRRGVGSCIEFCKSADFTILKEIDGNEWKPLEKDNLPPDILTGNYEFKIVPTVPTGVPIVGYEGTCKGIDILDGMEKGLVYTYRKIKPKHPSHEEIMTLWWLLDNEYQWYKVVSYSSNSSKKRKYFIGAFWKDSSWFTGRKSATIPPEDMARVDMNIQN